MKALTYVGLVIACASPLWAAGGVAWAQEAGANCGTYSRYPAYDLWNYDTTKLSCADATAVMDRFFAAAQAIGEKYATVDTWSCGINGAAEVDREGGRIADCKGPMGWLTLETATGSNLPNDPD